MAVGALARRGSAFPPRVSQSICPGALEGAFRVVRTDGGQHLGYAEYVAGQSLISKPSAVGRLLTFFEDLQAASLNTDASVRLLEEVRDELA
ncbi:Scr1 family TA system antitoxin-like transcriptional regulator [Nocardiopsis chromatogenes]|uniref:Scr1 family TA system antitoxin-like transcriptional regulator n=1 Tax=Nocardiopsis chromatogenes TaxID=280239 RepID=UPI00373AF594